MSVDRRTFLKGLGGLGLSALGVAVGAGITTTVSNNVSSGLQKTYDYFGDRMAPLKIGAAARGLVGDRIPAICCGAVNRQAVREGKAIRHSSYIETARLTLQTALCEAWGEEIEFRKCSPLDAPVVNAQEFNDMVFLGGPLANDYLAHLLGYRLDEVQVIGADGSDQIQSIPRADPAKFALRFEHFHGDGQLGEFDGRVRTAERWDDFNLVTRPQFAIFDHKTQQMLRCETDGQMLASEYLQVVKLPSAQGGNHVFIWGLHGHSIQSFFEPSEARSNMDALISLVGERRQFQALIPITLRPERRSGGFVMAGRPVWEKAIVEDLKGVFG